MEDFPELFNLEMVECPSCGKETSVRGARGVGDKRYAYICKHCDNEWTQERPDVLDFNEKPSFGKVRGKRERPYLCGRCGMPKKGHVCPLEGGGERGEGGEGVLTATVCGEVTGRGEERENARREDDAVLVTAEEADKERDTPSPPLPSAFSHLVRDGCRGFPPLSSCGTSSSTLVAPVRATHPGGGEDWRKRNRGENQEQSGEERRKRRPSDKISFFSTLDSAFLAWRGTLSEEEKKYVTSRRWGWREATFLLDQEDKENSLSNSNSSESGWGEGRWDSFQDRKLRYPPEKGEGGEVILRRDGSENRPLSEIQKQCLSMGYNCLEERPDKFRFMNVDYRIDPSSDMKAVKGPWNTMFVYRPSGFCLKRRQENAASSVSTKKAPPNLVPFTKSTPGQATQLTG